MNVTRGVGPLVRHNFEGRGRRSFDSQGCGCGTHMFVETFLFPFQIIGN